MSRVDFPDSPSNGATVTANGITYIYNAAKGVWRDNATAGIASDNPPANPVEGQMWFNSTEAALYFYYNDGSSAQWVSVSGPAGVAGVAGPASQVHMGIASPAAPDSGEMWYDTETNDFSLYYKDGTSNQWITVSGPKGDDGVDATLSSISESIIPDTDSAYDLGSPTNKFRSLYLSSNTLFLGDSASISAGAGGEIVLPSIKIGTGDNAVKLEADASGKLKTKQITGGVTQAAEDPGNAIVVSDMAGLIAVTGMSAGRTALVTGLNKVFMYTGSAWYLIATMTNASPTDITGVNATYSLATDGTATTVTAVSTDPEGFPLTWSYAVTTGSLGSTATVSQADNVFTITPSSTEADAGSFSITFSVTDGATGVVNAVSAFTLSFSHVFGVNKIQNSSNANYDISGMFRGNAVCTLSSSYTTSGSDTLVTDTSGTQWKLFASFTNNATSTRWGGNKEVQGQLSTYDFSDLTTPRLPPYTGILSYGDIKIYGPNNGLGGGAGGYAYYSDGSVALFNSVKLAAVAWAPLTAAQGASSGYAYNTSTPTAGDENGGPSVAGGWAQQTGGFMVIKPPQGTSEMWITGFNAWQGGGTSYVIFNESDGAITSQSGHGSGTNSGLGPANDTDAGMLNDAGTYTTILPITDGQLFMQHEMGPQACGIAYVLTR